MLTTMFDEVSERGLLETPKGMAYWAGTGPASMKCRDCVFFSKAKTAKKGLCGKYADMMRKKAPDFDSHARACKYFVTGAKVRALRWRRVVG